MDKKTIFFDVETTGRDCRVYDIIQISLIVDINKKVEETLTLNVRPLNEVYEVEALKVNGLKWDDILRFQDPKLAYGKIINMLERHMPFEERGMYDNRDKFNICAYNGKKFDIPFLKAFFIKNSDNRINRFFNKVIDPYEFLESQRLLAQTCGYNFPLKSLKLTSLCELLGIEFEGVAHDAKFDTIALRELVYKLGKIYKPFKFSS